MRLRRITATTMAISAISAAGLTAISAPAQAATPSYLFTVEAAAGSTASVRPAQGEDERFTITMRGVEPVTKFADRPFRSASVMSPAALVSNWDAWFADSPPNAVLSFVGGTSQAPQSIVVTLTRPRFDNVGRTLTFTASRTYRTLDPSQKGKNWKRPATPRAFTGASLFIDDAGSSVTDSLVAQMQQTMQNYVFQPNDQSTWSAVQSALSGVLTQAWQQGTLMGPTASTAFSVSCAPTSLQILNGYLSCSVSMQLSGGSNYSTTLTQQMAASG
jgi:hypothetical protein